MQALSLCKLVCPDKLTINTTTCLGDGADGDVYNIQDDPNKVIKFAVLYQWSNSNIDSDYVRIDKVLSLIETTNPPAYARVYKHGFLYSDYRIINGNSQKQKYILYYYILEKLNQISTCEAKVFHSILSHEDGLISKNYPLHRVKKMLEGMSSALDFDMTEVLTFYNNVNDCSIHHNDIHPRNIMKTNLGKFRLIDFDRSTLGE